MIATNTEPEPEKIVEPIPSDVATSESIDHQPDQFLLKDLIILPPRQKDTSPDEGLLLPPLRAEEPVQSLRAALSEVAGFAHITNFRFELEQRKSPNGVSPKKLVTAPDLASPYTGKDSVVMVPNQVKSLDSATFEKSSDLESMVLDEYGDLTPLLEKGLKNGSVFRMVLERYDAASIRDHVSRLRSIFDGNAPTVTSLVEDNIKAENPDEEIESQDEPEKKSKTLPSLQNISSGSVKLDGTNVEDFFYLSCGEYPEIFNSPKLTAEDSKGKTKKKKKLKSTDGGEWDNDVIKEKIVRWNELEEITHIPCIIQFSGFHPPPPHRRLMGDIAYFQVIYDFGCDANPIHITATVMGFYVNKSDTSIGNRKFDPSPATSPCFSHTLLDCLLQASHAIQAAWKLALDASKERSEVIGQLNSSQIVSLFPLATRGDVDGFKTAAAALRSTRQALDASLITPSWLAPVPRKFMTSEESWNRNNMHSFSPSRADEDIHNTFGVDVRNGAIRDWNEELQLAREMPTTILPERIERARLIHKVMTEFGEASLLGVKAIVEGQISPMNPNEGTRSQVYLHNNIFFSRAVDAGPETFKIAKGDKAARKAANRDVQCIGTFHRMEKTGLFTLATVLIDYLGTRFVCQSILPGILIGEKSHTLLYGSVETCIPLKWDEELHKLLENKVGEGMMIATRPVYRMPLTAERLEQIAQQKKATILHAETEKKILEAQEGVDPNSTILTCVPIEAKGILGSDQRKYVLDFGRLTPRDASWVPKEKGGTGKYESPIFVHGNGSKGGHTIPASIEDDEWTMCVLRPELVTRFTQVKMAKHIQARKRREYEDKEAKDSLKTEDNIAGDDPSSTEVVQNQNNDDAAKVAEQADSTDKPNEEKKDKDNEDQDNTSLTSDDLAYLKSLRLNINVFLPHIRSFEGVIEEADKHIKADEELAREIASFLWDDILPKITRAVREGSVHQLPVDGKTLTEFLHRNGANCRYLGQLAILAREQEERDAQTEEDLKKGQLIMLERRTMPKFWLELIECEIVARSAKHVLDNYLTENGGVSSCQPAQTVASFLSALVSEREETAAQTEARLEKRTSSQPDDEDFGALTLNDVGGAGDAVPNPVRGRYEVWKDIEEDVGRRFRCSLSLYNNGNKLGRALYVPLLRRVCQRSGVRLIAQKYEVGGKCLCSAGNTSGGRLTASYPISPIDIVDIVPLMKHSAAYSEGFTPCAVGLSIGLPSLQVSLQDARTVLERAHIQASGHALGKGLELAQEAASLYQRVTENAAHPGVIESVELMATIFMEAGDLMNAAVHGEKALGLTMQNSGFDSAGAFNAHMSLFQMLFATREMDRSVKHLRAAIYLLELMAGPRHTEIFSAYHKLGTIYSHIEYENKYLSTALECFHEASKRDSCDRLMEGIMAKNFAKVHAGLENFRDALEFEKTAYRTLTMFLGKDHQLTRDSENDLKNLAKLALEKGNKVEESDKMKEEVAKAEAIAADLAAEEEEKSQHSKKKKKGKK